MPLVPLMPLYKQNGDEPVPPHRVSAVRSGLGMESLRTASWSRRLDCRRKSAGAVHNGKRRI